MIHTASVSLQGCRAWQACCGACTFCAACVASQEVMEHVRRCIVCVQFHVLSPLAAGVPGMVAGMLRHLHSLRRMERDHGWIHTMLEEAENERM